MPWSTRSESGRQQTDSYTRSKGMKKLPTLIFTVCTAIGLFGGVGMTSAGATMSPNSTTPSSFDLISGSALSSPPIRQEFPPGTLDANLPTALGWGNNTDGAIGDATVITRLAPVVTNGGTALDGHEVSAIDAGGFHTCAIAELRAYCWGSNSSGQLGTDSQAASFHQPARVKGLIADKDVSAISASDATTCAVASRKAYCWGENSSGQLGTGNHTDSKVPQLVLGIVGKSVTAISAGPDHSCAIASGRAYCWGDNGSGQLGDNSSQATTQAVAVSTSGVLSGKAITSIAVGAHHTCVAADGKAYCWGDNGSGQLGNNSALPSSVPTQVNSTGVLKGLTVKAVAVGEDDSCVVAGSVADRKAFCWGEGGSGQLGNSGTNDSKVPVAVSASAVLKDKKISSISIHGDGGCVVATGKGYCWGDLDEEGRLGSNGQPTHSLVPVPVSTAGALKVGTLLQISTDWEHTAGVANIAKKFVDVPANQPFIDDINWLSGSGTGLGHSDGTFRPNTDIDRQAMAAFLFRYANPGVKDPVCGPGTRDFTDVHQEDQFCGPIEWLVSSGILPGGGKFRPVDPTMRSTMAAFLYRIANPGVADLTCAGGTRLFSDVAANTAHCGSIEWLAKNGITTGYDDGEYKAIEPVHRDAMGAFFHRLSAFNSH